MAPTVISRLARAGRNMDLTWRYVFNLSPTLAYKFNRPSPMGEAARVLTQLNRDGIAITSAAALLGAAPDYDELKAAVTSLEQAQRREIEQLRARASNSDAIGEKTFVFPLLGEYPVLDPKSVYARFALQPTVLQIANSYFGMYTRLRYYNIWHTLTTTSAPRESQLWHQDREDHLILKMFVYFSNVGPSDGPFTYAPGTHRKGHLRRAPAYTLEGNVKRSTDEQMAAVLSPEQWVTGTGAPGTIIFADTRGYHKGGLARDNDRIMYVCMFTSQASQSKEFMQRKGALALPPEKELAFALTLNQ